jgi:formylglycine-generating enzyme required for sulfatase activity
VHEVVEAYGDYCCVGQYFYLHKGEKALLDRNRQIIAILDATGRLVLENLGANRYRFYAYQDDYSERVGDGRMLLCAGYSYAQHVVSANWNAEYVEVRRISTDQLIGYVLLTSAHGDSYQVTTCPTESASAATATPRLPTVTSVPPTPTPTPLRTSEMLLIPAGTFQRGCDPAHAYTGVCRSDLPLYTVYLDAYRIDKTETTVAQYARCVAAGGCTVPASFSSFSHPSYYDNPIYANHPVIWVSWYQANAYCAWAGKRLPTAAEWEKAARGSSDTRPLPWGDADPSCTLANFRGCIGDTTAVGSYPAGASPYGVLDLVGNVREWVGDWYHAQLYDYDRRMFARNPLGPVSGPAKETLGGSWTPTSRLRLNGGNTYSSLLLAGEESTPASAASDLGFRCASSPSNETGQPNASGLGIAPTKAPAVTAIPTVQMAPPKPGTANAVGRVLWNNEPVSGAEVNLCAQYSVLGCDGNRYATKTDPQGYFVFGNVTPNPYYLLVHAIDADRWFFQRPANASALSAPITYTLTAGETLRFEAMQIWKYDLGGASAKPGEKPEDETATLSWQAYPGAAYYGVYMGEQLLDEPIGERVNGNSITVTKPPVCKWWKIAAYNAQGMKIAQSRYLDFAALRSPDSCGEAVNPVATTPTARPTAPVLPKVGQDNATALPAGQPVSFQIMTCPTQGVTIAAITVARPGWWNISGSAEILNFDYWKGEISADGKSWSMLYRSSRPVQNDVLIEFNTGTVPRGTYQVRLMAVDRTGNYPEPCIIQVSTR